METDSEGTMAVRIARQAIEAGLAAVGRPDPSADFRLAPLPEVFEERRGVFVTLKNAGDGRLRGCIGFPLPVYPLRVAIPRAAWAAATEDPRFPRVRAAELKDLRVEVSILTVPQRLAGNDRASRLREVVVGRDGLAVEGRGTSGLLLPQVAVELDWDSEIFLKETCNKAGLPESAWEDPDVTVRRFQAEVFSERSPGGPVDAGGRLRASPGSGGASPRA